MKTVSEVALFCLHKTGSGSVTEPEPAVVCQINFPLNAYKSIEVNSTRYGSVAFTHDKVSGSDTVKVPRLKDEEAPSRFGSVSDFVAFTHKKSC